MNKWQQPKWQRQFGIALVDWFSVHRRELPWRETRDPYRIWVSEIMLQQTQVVTVIPYFQRFLERFPSVNDLAAAETSDVLRLWEGLGYYRRARQLHAAAQEIVSHHHGVLPESIEALRSLPGIGRYTAGAILSIAHDQRQPILEANTVRLFSRIIGLQTPPAKTAAQKLLWSVAESLLPEENAGQFNQAAMELGSLVCTPKEPQCDCCPIQILCVANEKGLQQSIPGRVKRIQYESITEHAAAIRDHRGRVWLRRRTADERWTGLWDFPRYEPAKAAEDFLTTLGFSVRLGERIKTIRHGVTRFRITLHLTAAVAEKPAPRNQPEARWFTLDEIKEVPLTAPARKLCSSLHSI